VILKASKLGIVAAYALEFQISIFILPFHEKVGRSSFLRAGHGFFAPDNGLFHGNLLISDDRQCLVLIIVRQRLGEVQSQGSGYLEYDKGDVVFLVPFLPPLISGIDEVLNDLSGTLVGHLFKDADRPRVIQDLFLVTV